MQNRPVPAQLLRIVQNCGVKAQQLRRHLNNILHPCRVMRNPNPSRCRNVEAQAPTVSHSFLAISRVESHFRLQVQERAAPRPCSDVALMCRYQIHTGRGRGTVLWKGLEVSNQVRHATRKLTPR